jgi:hypothetical protein
MTSKRKAPRNPIAVAMRKRHQSVTPMRDRREERSGDKNEQAEFIEQYEEDIECEEDFD